MTDIARFKPTPCPAVCDPSDWARRQAVEKIEFERVASIYELASEIKRAAYDARLISVSDKQDRAVFVAYAYELAPQLPMIGDDSSGDVMMFEAVEIALEWWKM